jgi:DNA-binding NarL/FixJ family response regulator
MGRPDRSGENRHRDADMIQVAIIDDHPIARCGEAQALADSGRMHVGSKATVDTYVERIRAELHVGNKPELTRAALDRLRERR